MLLKNSYGCTIAPNPKFINPDWEGQFRGSSLDRNKTKNEVEKEIGKNINNDEIETNVVSSDKALIENVNINPPNELTEINESKIKEEIKPNELRTLSSRTKTKIKKKIYSFFGQYKKLTFLTLTFSNIVTDKLAVKILAKFLDNTKKADKDFEYLWVAEKQTKNEIFKDNIHFHLITNKFWNIKRYWNYWLDLQKKNGVAPRNENYKASSAFDVKVITTKNVNGIGIYLTKYVSKNKSKFDCQPWNCSKKVSMLYTDFYTRLNFLDQLERLEKKGEIFIKRIKEEYCNLFYYPINKITRRFYDGLHAKNKELWVNK